MSKQSPNSNLGQCRRAQELEGARFAARQADILGWLCGLEDDGASCDCPGVGRCGRAWRGVAVPERGFSLLEVVITLGILMTLVFAVAQLMRSSFDVREGLAQDARVTLRANGSLQRIAYDLKHAFLISSKDPSRTQGARRTVFRIEKSGKSDVLTMTFMGHRAVKANAKEGDLSYVVYEVKASPKFPHRSNLYRGELPRVPVEVWKYKETPPMRLIAENIESVRFEPWRGDDWLRDKWDSSAGDGDNRLPSLVRVTIRAWAEDPVEDVQPDSADEVLVQYSTVVPLAYSGDFNELKDPLSTFKL